MVTAIATVTATIAVPGTTAIQDAMPATGIIITTRNITITGTHPPITPKVDVKEDMIVV